MKKADRISDVYGTSSFSKRHLKYGVKADKRWSYFRYFAEQYSATERSSESFIISKTIDYKHGLSSQCIFNSFFRIPSPDSSWWLPTEKRSWEVKFKNWKNWKRSTFSLAKRKVCSLTRSTLFYSSHVNLTFIYPFYYIFFLHLLNTHLQRKEGWKDKEKKSNCINA